MNYYIISFVKLIVFVVLVALWIYLEDYVQRGLGLVVGMLVILIGVVIYVIRERVFFCMVGFVLLYGSLCTGGIELHIEEAEGSVMVRSPFYTHILERGIRVEEKELRTYYSKENSRVDVEITHFYFLYHETGSISIFNTYEKINEVDTTFVLKSKDFGDGVLDYINYHGANYDLRGTIITDGYKPYYFNRIRYDDTPNW